MKKRITIGVIAVMAAILVTNAVDFSAEAVKPIMSPVSPCPTENSHIITTYDVRPGIEIQHATKPSIPDGSQALVSTIHHIDDAVVARVPHVVDRLNELGYFVNDGSIRDVTIGDVNNAYFEDMIPYCMES